LKTFKAKPTHNVKLLWPEKDRRKWPVHSKNLETNIEKDNLISQVLNLLSRNYQFEFHKF
jgi:hypothetical protein